MIPIFIRDSASQRSEELPQRPAAQRQDPVRNPRFNPVFYIQFRIFEPLPAAPRDEENAAMTAGFGYFPPMATLLFTYDFSCGESGHAPLDVVSTNHIRLSTAAVVVLMLFFAIVI